MNNQSYPFQIIFLKKDIPHSINNRITFYQTKVIQNIFHYLRFIINTNSDCNLKKFLSPKQVLQCSILLQDKHTLFS